jgi:hypothetical protein
MLAERLAEQLKPLIFKDFPIFILFIPLIAKCIEKTSFLPAKIVPSGWAGLVGYIFPHMRKSGKKLLKCLIFNDLLHSAIFPHPFRILSASIPQRINSLIFNALPTSYKSLIFNDFLHFCGAGAVRVRWWVGCYARDKQGIRWLGGVMRVLSKGVKFGARCGCLV